MTPEISTTEAARILGVSTATIRTMCERGKAFPHAYRFALGARWRIPRADVDAFIESTRPHKRSR